MKNREYTVVKVYTQANGKKIAVSMLHTVRSGFYDTIKPTAEIEKYGRIEGVINSYWGKLPVVLVPAIQFTSLKKEYETVDYRGPVECTRIRESKPRPDAAALKLYKVFAADAAAPQIDADGCPVQITIDGYSFPSGSGESLLKALKREYSFTKADIAAAYALTLDNAPTEVEAPAEPAAAPCVALVPVAVAAEVEKVEETAPAAEVEKVEEKAPAFATVGDMAVPNITPIMPADSCPEVGEVGDRVKYKYSDYNGTIIQSWYHDIYLNEWRCTVVLDDGKEIHPTINNLTIITAAETPAPASEKTETAPASEKTAESAADAVAAPAAEPLAVVWTDDMDNAITSRTADACPLPDWAVDGVRCTYTNAERGRLTGTACRFHWVQVCHCWLCDFSNDKITINGAIVDNIKPLAAVDAHFADLAAHDTPASQKTAADATPAPAAADTQPAAADIKEIHEAIKQQTGADAFAEAITAYCAAMEEPAAPVCYPEVIIIKEQPAPATDAAPAPRRRHLSIAPRLSRWLHPARWVAVAFVVCLLCGLLMGTNASTAAADAATDDIAAVHELPTLTVTAPSLTTAPAAPSSVKKLAAPSPVKKATASAATPSGQKNGRRPGHRQRTHRR